MTTTLILLSGGLDSTVLAAHYVDAGHDIHALAVNYGQRHERELDSARAVADHYGARFDVLDMRNVGALLSGAALTDGTVPVPDGHYAEATMKATIVPNRNMIMMAVAAGVAVARGCTRVAAAMHAGDHYIYPDCRPAYVGAFAKAAQLAVAGVSPAGFTVEAPFVSWTKADIVKYGYTLDAPLYLTWSCYKGGRQHCGTCGTCYERREAFELAGVDDPTGYVDSVTRFSAPERL